MIADLCTEVTPAAPDAAEAAIYAQAGDDARAAGDVRIAAVAYRKALALGDARAKQALAELCRADAEPGDEAALQAAIAQVQAGELSAARAVLVRIVEHGTSSAAGAHFFLGAIALRSHDHGEAETELALAARDPAYAEPAKAMLRLARRAGRIEVNVFAGGEVDTNPQLLPDTPPPGATTAPPTPDENALLAITVAARPVRWLVLRDALVWRKQRTQRELDFLGNDAQASVELDDGPNHVAIRYDLDDDVLDGAAYLIAHRGTTAFRRQLGPRWEAFGAYSLRRRDFLRATEAAFTGWVHSGEAGATYHATPALDVDGKLFGWREITVDPLFANVTVGGQLAVRARPHGRVHLGAAAGAWYADYDGAEADGELREDLHVEGSGDLEVDVSEHLIATGAVTAAMNTSTIDDFRYWKLVVRIGLAFVIGGP